MRNRRVRRRPAGRAVARGGADPAGAPRLRLGGRGGARRPSGSRVAKRAGRVRDLADACPSGSPAGSASGTPGGRPTVRPTTSTPTRTPTPAGAVAVVHNGIIDNAAALRRQLTDDGVELASDTDTEVIAHLVARSEADTPRGQGPRRARGVEGTYGLAVMHADFPDRIVVARNGSPLIIGVGEQGDARRLRPRRAGAVHDDGRPSRRRRAGDRDGDRVHDVPART